MMSETPQSRLPGVGTTIFTIMSQAAVDHGAVNVGQGFPDFEPPPSLLSNISTYVMSGPNQYAPMAGALCLREAIAEKVLRRYGRAVSPDAEITVTCGATEGLACSIQALVHPGDEAIVLEPAFDTYEPVVVLAGGVVRHVPLQRPDFSIDWERVKAALSDRTRLVIINSPHNPSGACLSRSDLDTLAALLRPTRAFVVSDEVYEHMVFDGSAHVSVHAHPELAARSVVVSSFGKTYHATGWKIGYCIAPGPLTVELRKVHQFLTFSIATPLQHGIADFVRAHPEWEDELPRFYQAKRDLLIELLRGSKFNLKPSAGTYFQLVDYSEVSMAPDMEFAFELVRRHGVATIPLTPFMHSAPPGERLLRLCFAKSDSTLQEAALRLRSV